MVEAMKRKEKSCSCQILAALLICVIAQMPVFAKHEGWQREEVNLRAGDGSVIKAIEYPQKKLPPMAKNRSAQKPEKKYILTKKIQRKSIRLKDIAASEIVLANSIDSPAVDGFTPWIAVSITNARGTEDEFEAETEESVVGSFLTGHPESDYIIGIYDTGASAHVMGNQAGNRVGLFTYDLITSNPTTVSGVTGSVEAWVSQPIGVFIGSLDQIEPNGLLWDRSKMMGQSNVAIMVGQGGEPVDLPTAIGSPMSVYYTATFDNTSIVTRTKDGNDYNCPAMHIYHQDDSAIPTYSNMIPLELRPLGAASVQYIPTITGDFTFEPVSPSVIIGTSSQSVFFVSSVDLYDRTYSAIDKTRFMLDTGAQVSVIGSRIAARLALNPATPEFQVEIEGVNGESITAPGFYIDAIDIPSLGEWLSFTNIPVILLDVSSPEGGTVDGIIGMNLFTDINFTLRGGGIFLLDDPAIEYEPILGLPGDINGDGIIDWLDIDAFADSWLAATGDPNFNWRANLAADGIINFFDFAVFMQNWH